MIWAVTRKLGKPGASAGYLELVGPYNGELDQTEGPEDFKRRIRGQFPAVLVAAGAGTMRAESAIRTRFARALTVDVYVASDHLRSYEHRLRMDEAAEQDPTADPGIFQIVEDLHSIIAGNDFGLDCVGYLNPSREDVVLQTQDFTVWRMQFETTVDAHVNPRDHGDTNWTEYALDANLDPDDVPTPPNPFVEADGSLI